MICFRRERHRQLSCGGRGLDRCLRSPLALALTVHGAYLCLIGGVGPEIRDGGLEPSPYSWSYTRFDTFKLDPVGLRHSSRPVPHIVRSNGRNTRRRALIGPTQLELALGHVAAIGPKGEIAGGRGRRLIHVCHGNGDDDTIGRREGVRDGDFELMCRHRFIIEAVAGRETDLGGP